MVLKKNLTIKEYAIDYYINEYTKENGDPISEEEAAEIKSICESKSAIEAEEWLKNNGFESKTWKEAMSKIRDLFGEEKWAQLQNAVQRTTLSPTVAECLDSLKKYNDRSSEIAQRQMQSLYSLQDAKIQQEQRNREELANMIANSIVNAQNKNLLPWDCNPVIKDMIEDQRLLISSDGKHLRLSLSLNTDTIREYPITSKYLIDLGYIQTMDGKKLTYQNIRAHLTRH